jgi:predicted alpha-1,6-mannanase (GH76 family)
LKWAERTLEWIRVNKLYDGKAIVDAPGHSGDYWSTNQGIYIGVLTALFQATKSASYLDEAATFAETALFSSGLTTADGVLVEKLGVSGDASLFKGVFARYLAQLRDVLRSEKMHPATAEKIDKVIQSSAASLQRFSAGNAGFYRAEWHDGAKESATGFNAQVSALAAFVAAFPTTSR